MHASHFLAPLLFAATTAAQAVPEGIAPSVAAPSECRTTADGNFTIGTLKVGHHARRETAMEVSSAPMMPVHVRLIRARQATQGALVCTLKDGVLRDSFLRTGSVVANRQFQFDGPPQAGAIYTGGFSVCNNGSVAIGGTTRWWQCSSGGFYNLYDEWIGAQCEEIRIQATFPQKPTPSSLAVSSSVSSSASSASSVPVVSIASSLITISGTVSTLPSSAVGPSASFSSGSANASMTSGASSATPTPTGTAATATGSAGAGATGAAPAPPAGGAASLDMTRGTIFGAVVAFAGAVFIL
jgi:hypothetical protein